jgi:hypothetical protein
VRIRMRALEEFDDLLRSLFLLRLGLSHSGLPRSPKPD